MRRLDRHCPDLPLFDVAHTRRIEAAALAPLPAHALMQRAGAAVARLALALAPHANLIRIVAGTGNNGGDGIDAAIRLQHAGKAHGLKKRRGRHLIGTDARHQFTW